MMHGGALPAGARSAMAGLASAANALAPAPAPGRQARAIKPPPAVAPDRAAKAVAAVPPANAGSESIVPGKARPPQGWWNVLHAGPLCCTFEHGTQVHHGGECSLRVTNAGPEPFGAIYHGAGGGVSRLLAARFSVAAHRGNDRQPFVVADLPPRAEMEAKGVAK